MAAITEDMKVKYNYVGKSGLKVSNICLGTMTFGKTAHNAPGQTSEEDSHKIMDRFAAWGGNFLDTADIYGRGNSELIVGTWLEKQVRDNFVIATKVRFNMQEPGNVNCAGLSRRHLVASLEKSLERLRTNYIDIYQTHLFDNAVPLEETYRTLDDMVRSGKIRYAGVSNVTGWQLQKIVDLHKTLGLNPIVSLQQQYNLACRESEWEPFQVCKTEGVAVFPWSPLKGGLLTGKVRRGQKPSEGRLGWVAQDAKRKMQAAPLYSDVPDRVFDVIDAMEAIGKKHDRSIAQVALRWTLQKDVVTSTIIGATRLSQLDQNMAVNGWGLSAEEMQQLDDISAPVLPYPYKMVFEENEYRVNHQANDYFVQSIQH